MKEKLIEALGLKADASDEQVIEAVGAAVKAASVADETIAALRKEIESSRAAVGKNSRLTPAQEKDARSRAATGVVTYEQAVEIVLAQAAHDASQTKTAKA